MLFSRLIQGDSRENGMKWHNTEGRKEKMAAVTISGTVDQKGIHLVQNAHKFTRTEKRVGKSQTKKDPGCSGCIFLNFYRDYYVLYVEEGLFLYRYM